MSTQQAHLSRRIEAIALLLILLVAAGLRFYRLDRIPPGLTHDEADVGYFVLARYQGESLDLQIPYGYANEPYTQVSAALLMHVLGPNDLTLRVHQALYGLLAVLLTYLWARLALDPPTALVAAGLVAVAFWPVSSSRFALNPQPLPALFALAATAFWMALYRAGKGPRRTVWWAVFALALAATFTVYEAARVAWLAFPAYGVYLLFADRTRLRERGPAGGIALAVGVALALPHLLDPLAWGRTGTQFEENPDWLAGNILEGLGTLFVRGDTLLTYNPTGRPALTVPLAICFVVGVAVIVWRRRPGEVFAGLWLGVGLIPTLALGERSSTLHSIAAQPVVYIVAALGWMAAARLVVARWGTRLAGPLAALTVIGVALTGAETAHTYFNVWGRYPEVRSAYFHTLSEMTAHIQADDYGGTVIVSTPFPAPPFDPFIGLMRVQRDDVEMRWTDARAAVPLLDGRLYTSADAPLDPLLADLLALTPVEHVTLDPRDSNPYYDVYALDAAATLAALEADFTAPEGEAVFGGAVELLGYTVRREGDGLAVGTHWLVRDPAALGPVPSTAFQHDLAIFVQALDEGGQVIGQQDTLGLPTASWLAGESFLHAHHLTFTGEPPGEVTLLVGLYTRPDISRLPLTLDGEAAGDALYLALFVE
jgi:4-amino-4-deoxy-L-arabinose transferase-like glycosyltransferase